jgi:hypothetical protein
MSETTRRAFLQRAGLAALSAPGIYALVDGLAGDIARGALAAKTPLPPEQHLLLRDRKTLDGGIEILVPPRHHQIVTADLRIGPRKPALREAAAELDAVLRALEKRFKPTPAGLGVTVAWGLPYFRKYIPQLADGRGYPDYLPRDLRASRETGSDVPVVTDAIRYPSDPDDVILEHNQVAVQFRSDSLDNIGEGSAALFEGLKDIFKMTSIRRGFVGTQASDGYSLPKNMALRAKILGAEMIPDAAPLFLGFTSTNTTTMAPRRIANLESLPDLTDQWPDGYFRHGTTMHLSHLHENLLLWYTRPFFLRIWHMFDPVRQAEAVGNGTVTLPVVGQIPMEQIIQFDASGVGSLLSHGANMHPENRLQVDTVNNHGERYPKDTAILARVDFNTLDNPFAWSSRPSTDRYSEEPAAGLHFAAFSPTTDTFNRIRQAMDGRYRDGTILTVPPRDARNGLNEALRTTHRQNYLVPPRVHRSFPLSELL